MPTFAEQRFDRPNIWITCHPCRRGMFLFADHPMIADVPSRDVRFRCQVCRALVSAGYSDPRPNEPGADWTIMDMNGPTPLPMAPLTESEAALARNCIPIRRPRDPARVDFR
jgi:hypothetical protein